MSTHSITPSCIRIRRQSTTVREYVAIQVVIADLHLGCDLVDDRQIRLAKALADDHGISLDVEPEFTQRVATALR